MPCYVKSMEYPEYPKSLPVVVCEPREYPQYMAPLCLRLEYHDLANP